MAIVQDELIDAGISHGLIARDVVDRLRVEARQRRSRLVELAATYGRFPVASLYRAAAEERGIPFVDLFTTPPLEDLVSQLPDAILRGRPVLPVAQEHGTILVATADPDDTPTLENVQRILGQPLQVAVADPESLKNAVASLLSARRSQHATPANTSTAKADVVVDAVAELERILNEAYLRRASDVHLEAMKDGMRVRLRVDGRLYVLMANIHSAVAASIISRAKVLAGLDITEQRAPQDGRITYRPFGREDIEFDIRVAAMPTRWGERIAMRLIEPPKEHLGLAELGMSEQQVTRFRQVLASPHGMILLTGPTGSGKTTTLYAALREVNEPHRNVITVEDPVERVIPGISQVQVSGRDKVTFASAMRALVRHDPDILMVGEIRDHETADVALKAAMTGHLVFSTLHTNSAAAVVTRLMDMGCKPYLVGSTLTAVIAQRLVRRLCPKCKRSRRANTEEASLLGSQGEEIEVFEPGACANCMDSGYHGRIGLFEPLWIDARLRRLICQGASDAELEAQAHRDGGFTTVRQDAISKVLAGSTSLHEILAATVSEV